MNDKRSEILNLARTKVQANGLRDLSFRNIAEEVGIKSSSVHYYFSEKNDLTVALIQDYNNEFIDRLRIISKEGSTLQSKLLAFVDLFEKAAKNDQLCLCGMLASELSALNDECRFLLESFFKSTEGWVADVLKQHAREVNSSLPISKLAAVMMSGLEGALLLDRVHAAGQHMQSQRQLIASLAVDKLDG